MVKRWPLRSRSGDWVISVLLQPHFSERDPGLKPSLETVVHRRVDLEVGRQHVESDGTDPQPMQYPASFG